MRELDRHGIEGGIMDVKGEALALDVLLDTLQLDINDARARAGQKSDDDDTTVTLPYGLTYALNHVRLNLLQRVKDLETAFYGEQQS